MHKRYYPFYIDKVRTYSKTMSLLEATEKAVRECIKNDILKDFLSNQRMEAIKVTLHEFDQKSYEEAMREDGIEIGLRAGEAKIILNFLKNGMPAETIAKFSGCSLEFIREVKEANLLATK